MSMKTSEAATKLINPDRTYTDVTDVSQLDTDNRKYVLLADIARSLRAIRSAVECSNTRAAMLAMIKVANMLEKNERAAEKRRRTRKRRAANVTG